MLNSVLVGIHFCVRISRCPHFAMLFCGPGNVIQSGFAVLAVFGLQQMWRYIVQAINLATVRLVRNTPTKKKKTICKIARKICAARQHSSSLLFFCDTRCRQTGDQQPNGVLRLFARSNKTYYKNRRPKSVMQICRICHSYALIMLAIHSQLFHPDQSRECSLQIKASVRAVSSDVSLKAIVQLL